VIECINCKFWSRSQKSMRIGVDEGQGECRRNAPNGRIYGTYITIAQMLASLVKNPPSDWEEPFDWAMWPITDDDDFCGQGEATDEAAG
jgi:hypothetical protein